MAIDKNAITKEAQKYAAKGQFDKAIAEWKKIVRETPNDPNLYNTIGDLCLKRESKAEAVEAYKKAGDLLAADGFTSKAIALYRKVLNIDPSQIEVHLILGDLNVEKGLIGNALENYKFVASYYAQHQEMSRALAIYQKMADLSPSNIAFRLKLADMYAKEGMKQEASLAYLEAADVHVSKDAFQDARQIFEKVLALDPGNKAVYVKAGIVYYKEGKFNEACKAFKPALEADPANQELLDQYLDSLSKAGREADAEEVFKKLLAQDPGRLDLRDKLYQLYLAKQDYDKALDEAWVIAAARLESKEFDAAEEILKGFVASSPRNAAGRRKLASLYKNIDKPKEAAEELVRAAEILLEDGAREDAENLLVLAVELAPDLSEARRLLDSLHQTAPQPEPEQIVGEPLERAAHEPVSGETGAPAAAIEEDPSLITAIAEVEVLIKYGLAEKALEQLVGLVNRYPESPMALSRLSDLYHELKNEQKAVELACAVAALYERRGMPERAAVALHAAREWYPDNAQVLARLGMAPVVPAEQEGIAPPVFGEELDFAEPAPQAFAPEPEGTGAPVFDHDDLGLGGIDMHDEPAVESGPPGEAIELVAPESVASFMEEAASGEALIFEAAPEALEPFAGEPVAEEAPFIVPPAVEAPVVEPEREEEEPFAATEPVVEQQLSRPEEFERLEQEPLLEPEQPQAEVAEERREASAPGFDALQEPLAELDISEVWAEAEFYFQQGLFNEAKKHYAKIIQLNPGDMRAIARLSEISREAEETQEFTKLAEAVEDLEGFMPSGTLDGELATSESDEEAVRTLMREIQTLQKPAAPKKAAPVEPAWEAPKPAAPKKPAPPAPIQDDWRIPPPPKAQPPLPVMQAAASDDEEYFDLGEELSKATAPAAVPHARAEQTSDDFFDLAAELRDELSNVAVSKQAPVSAEDQTLDDIFEDFKKGVEAQEGKQDVDTHYNLGVSYKEMGLLDDAIAEFSLTPEGESKYVQSRYLLGLCYMEQGEYKGAIDEIHNALNYSMSYSGNADERIDMHYDLGLAYQGSGNAQEALAEFQHVYNADPGYRDCAAKLQELQHGQYVSMDQLKNDIEKEISAKFMEEGEKIERQEKSRKNEKVRS